MLVKYKTIKKATSYQRHSYEYSDEGNSYKIVKYIKYILAKKCQAATKVF